MKRLSAVLIMVALLNFQHFRNPRRTLAATSETKRTLLICHRSFRTPGRSVTIILTEEQAKAHQLHGDAPEECGPND